MFQLHLASHLHKTLQEIRNMPHADLAYWAAYFDLRRMEQKAAEQRMKFAQRKR